MTTLTLHDDEPEIPFIPGFSPVQLPLTNLCAAKNSLDIQMAVPGLRLTDLKIECTDQAVTVAYEAPPPKDPTYEIPDYALLQIGDAPQSIVDGWHLPSFRATFAYPAPLRLLRAIVTDGVLHIRLQRPPELAKA